MPLGRFVIITSLAWAVILFCTAGAYNFAGMMVVRFFLGVAEGGISPAYVLITASWYKKNEIPLRINIWFCGNGCASIVQAFLAYGIGHIDNTGIPVWRWFFIIFGMIGLVWSAVLWRWMPDSPLTAKFLDERERMIAVERLRQNRTGIANSEYKKDQMIEAFRDPKVWYGFFYAVCCVIPANAVANFGGLIIEGMCIRISLEPVLTTSIRSWFWELRNILTELSSWCGSKSRLTVHWLCGFLFSQ